jgi:uncharacterized membrane protein
MDTLLLIIGLIVLIASAFIVMVNGVDTAVEKKKYASFMASIVLVLSLLLLIDDVYRYKELAKVIIKNENNLTIKKIPNRYKKIFIELKTEIEKEQLNANNK